MNLSILDLMSISNGSQEIVTRRKAQDLQNICLNVVISNFNKILSVPDCERGVAFLRKHSQVLLKKFEKTDVDGVSLQHAKFCLNQYLWELDLDWFRERDRRFIVKKLGTLENTLTELWASEGLSLELLWQLILSLPVSLEFLSLRQTCCADKMLKVVAERCLHLQELDLYECWLVTDAGMKALCCKDEKTNTYRNDVLLKLHLDFTGVTNNGIAFILNNFVNLSELNHCSISNVIGEIYREAVLTDRLPNIDKYNLKSICIGYRDISPCDSLEALSFLCPDIVKLDTVIETQHELNACALLTSLKDVTFHIEEAFDCTLLYFLEARGNALKALTVFSKLAKYSVSSRDLVTFCPRLEYLQLYHPEFTEFNFSAEGNSKYSMPCLKTLKVDFPLSSNLEKSLLHLISRAPALEKFAFQNYMSPQYPLLVISLLKASLPILTLRKLTFLRRGA